MVGEGGGGGGGGDDDDDIVTQTPRTISPQEPFYSVFTILIQHSRDLPYHLIPSRTMSYHLT